MAERECYGVRRVVRLWRRGEIADAFDHVHDLSLLGPAVAHHRLLDLKRRILVDLHTLLLTGQQNHAPPVGDRNAGGNIGVEEQLLNRNGVRLEKIKQLQHIVVNLFKAA